MGKSKLVLLQLPSVGLAMDNLMNEKLKRFLPFTFIPYNNKKLEEYLSYMYNNGYILIYDHNNFRLIFEKNEKPRQIYRILIDRDKIDSECMTKIEDNHWVLVKKINQRTFSSKVIFSIYTNKDLNADDTAIMKHNERVAANYCPKKSFIFNFLAILVILLIMTILIHVLNPGNLHDKKFLISAQIGVATYMTLFYKNFYKAQAGFVKRNNYFDQKQPIEKNEWGEYFKYFEKKDFIYTLISIGVAVISELGLRCII